MNSTQHKRPSRRWPFFVLILCCFSVTNCSRDSKSVSDSSSKNRMRISILPYGKINEMYCNEVKKALSTYYQVEVNLLKTSALPDYARSPFVSSRYRADTLLRQLKQFSEDSNHYIVGLTDVDITCTKHDPKDPKKIKPPEWVYRDWGIFGLGSMPGNSCVVSVFRLGKNRVSKAKMLSRLRKIACHEVGHNLGLAHCPNTSCFMTDAVESIKTVDRATEDLCTKCKTKIRMLSTIR